MILAKMPRRRPVNTSSWKSGSLRHRVTRASLSAMRLMVSLTSCSWMPRLDYSNELARAKFPHALPAHGVFVHCPRSPWMNGLRGTGRTPPLRIHHNPTR